MRALLPLVFLLACNGEKPADDPVLSVGDDNDGDGYTVLQDCNDEDAAVGGNTFYVDADGDGFGHDDGTVIACTAPEGFVDKGGDCNDADDGTRPNEPEACDGVDNDCDGDVPKDERDADGDGQSDCAGDCDDNDDSVHSFAVERCNNADDDCDGTVDNNAVDGTVQYADVDGDGYGDPDAAAVVCGTVAGWVSDNTDCDDDATTGAAVNPAASELCSTVGVDDDCDGDVDEADAGDTTQYWLDADGDGYGRNGVPLLACSAPLWHADATDDCDDDDVSSNPGATEVCGDGADNDCDGSYPASCGPQPNQPASDGRHWAGTPGSAAGYPVNIGDIDNDGAEEIAVASTLGVYIMSGQQTSFDLASDAFLITNSTAMGETDDFIAAANGQLLLGDFSTFVLDPSGLPATGTLGLQGLSPLEITQTGTLSTGGCDLLQRPASAGDLNGDTQEDIAIGQPCLGATAAGGVYLFTTEITASLTTAGADIQLTASTASGRFGSHMAAGDFNGNAQSDLAVAAPGTGSDTGAVLLFDDQPVTGNAETVAAAIIDGEAVGDLFGTDLTFGDVTGDGYEDLVVAAPAYGTDAGRVYVFAGSASGLTGSMSAAAATTLFDGADDDRYPDTVATGDVDDDGNIDLVIGAPAPTDSGVVHVYAGPVGFGTVDLGYFDDDYSIYAERPNTELGASIAVGDFNGDTIADMMLGAPTHQGEGRIFLVLGGAGF